MSGVQIADAKAPFVQFELRAEEDREQSVATGRFVAKDVAYALITPHGSKDQIERVAEEWLNSMDAEVRGGRLPPEWASGWRKAYDAWKTGQEIPLEGTSIRNWPLASPAQVKTLIGLNVLTVEVLAAANESLIARLGMGGRSLVDKAKEYLKQADGPGKAASQITALQQQNEDLSKTVEHLGAQIEALKKLVPQGDSGQFDQQGIGADDLGLKL